MANDNIIEKLDIEAPVMANAQEMIQELQELVERAEQHTERYDLSWEGKARALAEAGMPINKTLRPDLDESVNFDETENLFITGDNLDALKLLQESYLGKVDMIYIDPPYNTGKDFVYHDKFSKTFKEAKEESKDDEGNRLYTVNSSDSGRYHSDWLSMMYPRLRIARNLMSDNGVIFISMDDNEIANLKLLCDEVFGENNFVGMFVWVRKKKGAFLSKKTRKMTEYILCYYKNENDDKYYGEDAYSDKLQPLVKRTNARKRLVFPANIVRTKLKDGLFEAKINETSTGISFINSFLVKNGIVTNEMITEGNYVWTQEFLEKEILSGTEIQLSSQLGFNVLRSNQSEKIKTPSTLVSKENNVGTNEDAAMEISQIFKSEVGAMFDYSKPTSLLEYLIKMTTYNKSTPLILDFFAGSGTTAHAVMKLNAEDGGNRKWILVQLDEATAKDSEARKAGYLTIDAIARERIRRAEKSLYTDTSTSLSASSDKIKRDPQDLFATENISDTNNHSNQKNHDKIKVGFRALRVDTNNINDSILKSPMETKQGDLFSAVDNIKKERTPLDLLFGTLISLALELNKPLRIVKQEIPAFAGMTGASVSQTLYVYDYFGELSGLVACFDDVISEEAVKEIARMKPLAAVFRDSSFATAAEKVNLSEHFRTLSPETKVKVI